MDYEVSAFIFQTTIFWKYCADLSRDYVVSPKIADGLRSFGFYISNITIFWKYCADLSKKVRRSTENIRVLELPMMTAVIPNFFNT